MNSINTHAGKTNFLKAEEHEKQKKEGGGVGESKETHVRLPEEKWCNE